jgi:sugar phosphate isomerase/epimerase
MPFVTLGAVSNCWTALLPDSSLLQQCRRAFAEPYGYVELRQRGLGDCEQAVSRDDRPWPIPHRLAELPRLVPELGYNLAVEAPFQTHALSPDDPYLRRCAEAAAALGGNRVLRLVDLNRPDALLDERAVDELGASIAGLARSLWESGVSLALENSHQPVGVVLALIRRAASDLPPEVPAPRLCWDPHNQVSQRLQREDPVETARTLPLETLFEFHFKQGGPGQARPDVDDGPLDWRAILQALRERGYRGPALFEIPAGPDIWDRLQRGTRYVQGLLHGIDA